MLLFSKRNDAPYSVVKKAFSQKISQNLINPISPSISPINLVSRFEDVKTRHNVRSAGLVIEEKDHRWPSTAIPCPHSREFQVVPSGPHSKKRKPDSTSTFLLDKEQFDDFPNEQDGHRNIHRD